MKNSHWNARILFALLVAGIAGSVACDGPPPRARFAEPRLATLDGEDCQGNEECRRLAEACNGDERCRQALEAAIVEEGASAETNLVAEILAQARRDAGASP